MTKDEALKLALEALKAHADIGINSDKAIAALEEVLAQPVQEPVAYLCENAVGHKYFRWTKPSSSYKPIPLYTQPSQRTWVGLTDEEIYMNCPNWLSPEQCKVRIQQIQTQIKEKDNRTHTAVTMQPSFQTRGR